MASRQVAIRQDSFEAGSFLDPADYLIPEVGFEEGYDLFLEEDGAAVERGGTVNKSNAAFGSSGRWIGDYYFDAGQRTVFANPNDFGVLSSDDATPINLGSDGLTVPKPSAFVAGLLFIGGGYIYGGSRKTATYTTGTVTVTNGSTTVEGAGVTWNTLVDAGMLFQRGNERVYRVASFTDTDTLELAEPYEGVTGAGIAYTLHHFYAITAADPYPDAEFYWTTAGRLMWAEKNHVYGTEPLKPHDNTATFGPEEVSLDHELPEGVYVTGGSTVGQTSLAFTTHGVWTIEGLVFDIAGPDGAIQHRLSRHSGEHILWDANGIASWEQALVVPCADGIYLMDGISEPLRVSHPFDEQVMSYVDRGYKLGQAAVFRGHYLLPVYSGTVTMRDHLVCRINRPIRVQGQTVHPWSRFARHASKLIGYAVRVGESTREPALLGVSTASDARVVECAYFDPSATVKADANGEIPTLDLTTRAYPTGNDTENMVRNVRTRYELVDAATDNPELEFSYSLGNPPPGLASYDTGLAYDDGTLYVDETLALGFTTLACVGPESNGREPKRCRVNEATRFFKWRIRNPKASAACRIRGIDIRVRPSAAIRR